MLKEETEAKKVLQTPCTSDPVEAERLLMSVGKITLNLEKKLSRLEIANEKLAEAYGQSEDAVAAEIYWMALLTRSHN